MSYAADAEAEAGARSESEGGSMPPARARSRPASRARRSSMVPVVAASADRWYGLLIQLRGANIGPCVGGGGGGDGGDDGADAILVLVEQLQQ